MSEQSLYCKSCSSSSSSSSATITPATMSLVNDLLENDPDETSISINLSDYVANVTQLARALEQNRFITDITLVFRFATTPTEVANLWDSFLRVIATREILTKVKVRGHLEPAGSAPFLQAIQQNPAVRSVALSFLCLSADSFATFLNTALSLTSLKIHRCSIVQRSDRGENGAWNRLVRDAFRRNTSIQTLELAFLDDSFMLPILESLLAVNGNVRTLIFETNTYFGITAETSRLMQTILESTTSIQRFELAGSYSEASFGRLERGLIASTSVSDIKFGFCSFDVVGASIHLQNIIRNKTNLTCLSVTYTRSVGSGGMEALVQALSRPNSPLRSFEFRCGSFLNIPDGKLSSLLRSIQGSKLERFSFHAAVDHQAQTFRALIRSIPAMKVMELEITTVQFVPRAITHDLLQDLLQALKRNYSLQQVQHDFDPPEFDAADQSKLDLYLERNKRLAQWVENPATVPRHLWPDATKLALEAGESALFASLRTVLGSDYTSSLCGKRKRKRPQYYEAS